MDTDFHGHGALHLLDDSATHPIEPARPRLGALLRLAGSSLLRCRAYPDAPATAHSGASNCGFWVERSNFRIATLVARPPRALLADMAAPAPLPALPVTDLARLPVGTTEQWLQRRPDLVAAERQLAAATATIGVARTELFPRLSLSGLLGLNAATIGNLVKSESAVYTLGVGLSWTPFDLGAIRARMGATEARALQSLVSYEQAVALALEETEGAFSSYTRSAQRAERQAAATGHAQEAARLARLRFGAGVADFSVVLDAEREVLTSEDALMQTQTATATALVGVYRALGGGWQAMRQAAGLADTAPTPPIQAVAMYGNARGIAASIGYACGHAQEPAMTQPSRVRLQPNKLATLAAGALLVQLTLTGAAMAQSLDTRLVVSGLSQPLFATAPLADGRLFVVEKGGLIKVVQGGVASTFLSVPVASGGEQGLLGLAFDPGYGNAASAGFGRFFVDYIDPTTLDTVVASYRRNAATGVADPASRVEVLRIDQPNGRSNHKAGWIGFKPGDANNLYIATGDGGSSNDPENRAQNKGELLGKLLRVDINRDDFPDANINYGVPLNNPFVGQAGARGEIYALGLRNPFRNSFDSATGNLWIADVGQGQREEIDFIGAASAGGQNFGWRQREGSIATPGISDPPTAGLIDPLLDYDHSFGASITGGYVVRDAASPLNGRYVFGDFISGRIFSIAADGSAQTIAGATELTAVLDAGLGGAIGNISSFGQGASGEFYIVDYAGKVVQVVPEPATALLMLMGAALLWARRRSLG